MIFINKLFWDGEMRRVFNKCNGDQLHNKMEINANCCLHRLLLGKIGLDAQAIIVELII